MFSIGDVVKLKSGGPAMTVWKNRQDLAEVEWFVGEELKRDVFHPDELLDMAEIAKAEAEFRKQRIAVEREIWDAYPGISCTNSSPATIIAGEGWAEAAFDEGLPDPQVLAMMLHAQQKLGYGFFRWFK